MNKTQHRNYKDSLHICVMMDFTESSYRALRYAMKLAKKIDSDIEIFHVLLLDTTVYSDNQAVGLRELNLAFSKIKRKLASIAEILNNEGVSATYSYSTGNVKLEIKRHLKQSNHRIVVIGNGKSKWRVGNYLLRKYSGLLIIVSDTIESKIDSSISIEHYSDVLVNSNLDLIAQPLDKTNSLTQISDMKKLLMSSLVDPIKNALQSLSFQDINIKWRSIEETNIVEAFTKYIYDEQVGLLCIVRELPKE